MSSNILTFLSAALLLGAALFAARGPARAYLRFAAILCAALAVAVFAGPLAPGLADAAMRLVLPLAGAMLGLYALARFGEKLPPLPATLCLTLALAAGLLALLRDNLPFAFIVPAIGGVVMFFAAAHRFKPLAMLAGLLLVAAACAFTVAGASAATLALLAAGLFGIAL